jgi:hypothetical protein
MNIGHNTRYQSCIDWAIVFLRYRFTCQPKRKKKGDQNN